MARVEDFATQRERMVRLQIEDRGIDDERLLAAMAAVPREAFVAPEVADRAYWDGPLPIASGQTISQPYIVALMIGALEIGAADRVLEIGTGSGYGAAVLSLIAAEVYTIERHADLANEARRRLAGLGYGRISVRHGDGTLGWPEHAPYAGIVITAAGPRVPEALRAQLDVGGRLVMPIGGRWMGQELVRIRRIDDMRVVEESMGAVRFVPLIGADGYAEGF